ncbi:MAG: GGDEF domain-containing protein [Kofleriaceae bacterium]
MLDSCDTTRTRFEEALDAPSLVDRDRVDAHDPFEHVRRLARALFAGAEAEVRGGDDGPDRRERTNPVLASLPLRSADGQLLGHLTLRAEGRPGLSAAEAVLLGDLAHAVERDLGARALATRDELTGLANRRGFVAAADDALAMCRRQGQPATLLYFDLDRFKAINDRFGHAAGDDALRTFAAWLRATFRATDVLARLGGDEFVVLATGSSASSIECALTRLRASLAATSVRFSVGVVAWVPGAHAGIGALLEHADAAMFANKAAHRRARPTTRRLTGLVAARRERRGTGRLSRAS